MIWLSVLLFLQASTPNPQIERGQTLFFADTGCGNCHALKGRGTAVGPDLKVLGRVGVRALVTAIRASRTEYVETIKLKEGAAFPAMKVSADATTLQYLKEGLIAGINAARKVRGQGPLILRRDQAYLGVLIDDLAKPNAA